MAVRPCCRVTNGVRPPAVLGRLDGALLVFIKRMYLRAKKGISMKRADSDELRPEYRREDLAAGCPR